MPRIRVLILGSYQSINRLRGLRDALIEIGVSNTRLVDDFKGPERLLTEDNDQYNLRKSQHWIDSSDISVFNFFEGVDNSSPSIELNFMIGRDKAHRCIVRVPENRKIGSLLKGVTRRYSRLISQIIEYSSDTDSSLATRIKGVIVSRVEELYNQVQTRPAGEWESEIS